jgi:hypothetical protein
MVESESACVAAARRDLARISGEMLRLLAEWEKKFGLVVGGVHVRRAEEFGRRSGRIASVEIEAGL